MSRKIINLYPLYFMIFPVLSFYTSNIKELELNAIYRPILGSIILLSAVWIAVYLTAKKINTANIASIIFALYFFSYRYYFDKVSGLNSNLLSFVFYTLIFVFIGISLFRLKDKKETPIFFTIVGLYLLFSQLVILIPYEVQRKMIEPQQIKTKDGVFKISKKTNLPDIYYFIFDRYANSRILKDQYGFDNSEFVAFLQKRGFYIASDSFTNYPKTHLALASSLNLDYLDELVKQIGVENSDYTPAFAMVQNNKVSKVLKSAGYRYIYFGDWWTPTQISKIADKNINLYASSDEFIRKFLRTTVLQPVLGDYYKGNKLFGFFQDRIYENTNYKFKKLEDIAKDKSPKFIFAHMLFPHHPYLFDKNCNKVDAERELPEEEKYIEQLKCANQKIEKMIDAIITKSKTPPIIILQSDEGPFKFDEMKLDGEVVDWTKVSEKAKLRHMMILNAYYLPGYDYTELYPTISPVNTFRLIFNHYFGANFSLLPDRSYFIPHIDKPYKYFEITEDLKFR